MMPLQGSATEYSVEDWASDYLPPGGLKHRPVLVYLLALVLLVTPYLPLQ